MWAFSVTTQRPQDGDLSIAATPAALAALPADIAGAPWEAASVEQVEAVIHAIESIANSGVLGPPGATLNVTVSGHANADHRPDSAGGGASATPDFVTISIAQVGYPVGHADGDVGGGGVVTTELAPPDAAAVVPPVGQNPAGWPGPDPSAPPAPDPSVPPAPDPSAPASGAV